MGVLRALGWLVVVAVTVGAVLVGAIWLLPAFGQECSGVRGYPNPGGDGFYCTGSLGPTHYWLNNHFYATWAGATGAVYVLWLTVRSGRRRLRATATSA